jgi:Tfp pilus assembly protein PilN
MIIQERMSLNLASHPLRNRKLFYLFLSIIGVVLLAMLFLSGKIFLEYRTKAQEVKTSIAETNQLIMNAQNDQQKNAARVKQAVKNYKGKVDLVNNIILKKSFSWIEFLSDLENALPDSSYIISLAPTLTKDSRMLLKFKAVSPNVNELLKLINNLNALGFSQINPISEVENRRGLLITEISLSYERNI